MNERETIVDFESIGLWWLPGRDNEKVPGVLRFLVNSDIKLELMGSFHESVEEAFRNGQSQYFDIVLGESKGTRFTLLRSQEIKKEIVQRDDANYIISFFHCDYILEGIHFFNMDEAKFAQMNINFYYLEDWVFPDPFKLENENTISYTTPPENRLNIKKIDSIITLISSQSVSSDFKTISMSVHSLFIIKPNDESKSLEWYETVIRCLGDFLTLAMGMATYCKSMTAYLPNNHEIKICFISTKELYEKEIHFSQMLIPYRDIVSYLERILNNWFDNSDLLEPVYELFFGTYYAQLYIHFYFLSLIQAIEAFHRRIYGEKGEYLTDRDYEPIRRRLTDSIPKAFPDERDYPAGFSDALKSKIRFGNEYSLRTRLKQMSRIWGPFDSLIYNNKDRFNNYIVCTRNYLTHYEKDPACRVFEGNDLISVNIILHSLFLTVLLAHMGVPKLDAFRIVKRHNGKAVTNAIRELFKDDKLL